jgi:hypothetical protein
VVPEAFPTTRDSAGRTVVFDEGSRLHLARRRPWLLEHTDAIVATVAEPDSAARTHGRGRERFYRQHLDLKRWLRVVVDFGNDPGRIVTVAVQRNDPRSSDR